MLPSSIGESFHIIAIIPTCFHSLEKSFPNFNRKNLVGLTGRPECHVSWLHFTFTGVKLAISTFCITMLFLDSCKVLSLNSKIAQDTDGVSTNGLRQWKHMQVWGLAWHPLKYSYHTWAEIMMEISPFARRPPLRILPSLFLVLDSKSSLLWYLRISPIKPAITWHQKIEILCYQIYLLSYRFLLEFLSS